MTEQPRVTIAGGGLAGLTAALRLAERGYRVKVYEQKQTLGGNLGSRPAAGGAQLDVYPHMYLGWYHNFWRLLGEVTNRDRATLFAPFGAVKQLRRGDFPRFTGPTDMYSVRHMLQNLFSGVGPVADMLVFGFASVDLLAERCVPTMLRDDLSVGGFLNPRPYMTERAAAAYNNFITTVWAIPSYLVSAEDYRTYLAYCFAEPTPAFWLARGSAFDQVISPLTTALENAGVEITRSVQLTSVSCTDGRVTEIGLRTLGSTRSLRPGWAPRAVGPRRSTS
jgi:phytoene dehydrogenase-like protein